MTINSSAGAANGSTVVAGVGTRAGESSRTTACLATSLIGFTASARTQRNSPAGGAIFSNSTPSIVASPNTRTRSP